MQNRTRQSVDDASHEEALQRSLNASAGDGDVIRAFCFALPTDGTVPEWVELIPAPDASGRVVGRDGRNWLMRDAAAVAANFDLRLPVDVNHSTELRAPKGEESPAFGWIEELQARNGAVWGRIDWTPEGIERLQGRKYRFISPVFAHLKTTGEIRKVTSAGLVNDPNFNLALNNRQSSEEELMSLKAIAAALGLAETATEAECITAINGKKSELQTALNAAQTPDLAKFVPRADFDAATARATNAEQKLAEQANAQREKEVDAEIDAALKAGKITPATKDYHRAMCMQEGGLEKFRSYIAATPVIVSGDEVTKPPVGADGKAKLSDNQRAICRQLGLSEDDYAKTLTAAQ
ncbi:phage protease [Solimonas flava]|uniref:phage protease n=1 Tax=Solimonas flava TaxID=415849 RepID=UPI00041913D0|nr:phage protease [Solimonas flava]